MTGVQTCALPISVFPSHDSRRREVGDFTHAVHYKSNAHKRRIEGLDGKNSIALNMVNRALNQGVEADYLLVDSWYAKPDFIAQAGELGMPVIARIANNVRIWNFKGNHKTLDALHTACQSQHRIHRGHYGKIHYTYFDAFVEHTKLGKVKLVFLRTHKERLVFISTHCSLSGMEIIDIYKKQYYRDWETDRKSTRLNSSHRSLSRMPSSA